MNDYEWTTYWQRVQKLYQQSIPNGEALMLTSGRPVFCVIYASSSGHSSYRWETGKSCLPSPGRA